MRRFLNQNHMLIHVFLYLKNITIWLMFLRDKKLTNWFHIKKNTTLKLIWNQKKFWILNLCMTCHETNCRCYDNTWMSILQKILFNQIIFHLHSQYCLQRNQMKNYDFALIIKLWTQSQFEINIQFSWFKKCSYIMNILWAFSVCNHFNFNWIHLKFFSEYNQSEIYYFHHMKLAFLDVTL